MRACSGSDMSSPSFVPLAVQGRQAGQGVVQDGSIGITQVKGSWWR